MTSSRRTRLRIKHGNDGTPHNRKTWIRDGHAVVARLLDIPIKLVTIDPRRGALGRVAPENADTIPGAKSILFAMAGPMAENMVTTKPKPPFAGDKQTIDSDLRKLPQPRRYYSAQTKELVYNNWPAIEAVAEKLSPIRRLLHTSLLNMLR